MRAFLVLASCLLLAGCTEPLAPEPVAPAPTTTDVPVIEVPVVPPLVNGTYSDCVGYGAYIAFPYLLAQQAVPEGFELVVFSEIVGVPVQGDPNAVMFIVASHCAGAVVDGREVAGPANHFYGLAVRPPIQYRFGNETAAEAILALGSLFNDSASLNLSKSWGIPAEGATLSFSQEEASPGRGVLQMQSPTVDATFTVACDGQAEPAEAFQTRFFAAKEGQLTGAINITVGTSTIQLGGAEFHYSNGAPLGDPVAAGLGFCLQGDPWGYAITQTVFPFLGPVT